MWSRKLRTCSRLTLQDLPDQVVDDVAVVAGEAGDEAGDVGSSLHRQRRQLERGDPSFGASLQSGDVGARQLQSHHLVEIARGLVEREAQISGPDLDELATRSKARQRQRRVGPAGDDQPDLRREVLHQVGHPVLDLGLLDDVVVVEHHHDRVGEGGEVVEQRHNERLCRRLASKRRSASAPSPTPGAAVRSAAMKYAQNSAGSLSLASLFHGNPCGGFWCSAGGVVGGRAARRASGTTAGARVVKTVGWCCVPDGGDGRCRRGWWRSGERGA